MDEIIQLIPSLGFPIVVTLWFMLRTEKFIQQNTEATNRLADLIEDLSEKKV